MTSAEPEYSVRDCGDYWLVVDRYGYVRAQLFSLGAAHEVAQRMREDYARALHASQPSDAKVSK